MVNQFHNSNSHTQVIGLLIIGQIIGLCQAMRGHFSRKSSYWSKNFIMVLNVKTMT